MDPKVSHDASDDPIKINRFSHLVILLLGRALNLGHEIA